MEALLGRVEGSVFNIFSDTSCVAVNEAQAHHNACKQSKVLLLALQFKATEARAEVLA